MERRGENVGPNYCGQKSELELEKCNEVLMYELKFSCTTGKPLASLQVAWSIYKQILGD